MDPELRAIMARWDVGLVSTSCFVLVANAGM